MSKPAMTPGKWLPLHAVVTGDIVASTQLPPGELAALPEQLRQTFRHVEKKIPVESAFSLSGGDGWQLYVEAPQQALRAVLIFRARLFSETGLQTRAAFAIDTVDSVRREDLNASNGPAFQRSGRALADLKGTSYLMRCLLREKTHEPFRIAADALCAFADHLAQNWTQAQAQAINFVLAEKAPITLEEIGKQWKPEPITKQTVGDHMRRAHRDRVEALLSDFERLMQHYERTDRSRQHNEARRKQP